MDRSNYEPKTILGSFLGLALSSTLGVPFAFISAADTMMCQNGFIAGFKEGLRCFYDMGAEIGDLVSDKVMGVSDGRRL
jgi:hypothetical protein